MEEQQQKAETHVVQLGANYEGLGLEGAPPPSEDLNARITLLQQELHLEQAERRKIHNALVDLKGNVSAWLHRGRSAWRKVAWELMGHGCRDGWLFHLSLFTLLCIRNKSPYVCV